MHYLSFAKTLYIKKRMCYTFFIMKTLVVATANAGKLKEIKELLYGRYKVVSMAEAGFEGDVEETGTTFYENALLKARTVSDALGVDALADDSGLEVNCLDGAPGVYSARYAGEPCDNVSNRALLLKNMQNYADRSARFTCTMVLYKVGGEVITASGHTEGYILTEEEGDNGFGYDCLFLSKDLNKSFGVATDEEKNAVSHRARALRALLQKLQG